MSANNITTHSVGEYNFYTVTGDEKCIIGGVPQEYCEAYIEEAKDAAAIVLLTSKPEFCGGIREVIKHNPQIAIYATAAGLRNIKEIANCDINEKLIKDGGEAFGIKFLITPNVHWVDTACAVVGSAVFTGELFSGTDKCDYYKTRLAVNESFVVSAVERIKNENTEFVYPAYGDICKTECAIKLYESCFTEKKQSGTRAVVIYHSVYGFTKELAKCAEQAFSKECETVLINATTAETEQVLEEIQNADILAVGTSTQNRNAPQKIWDIVTGIDLVSKRAMPYFVFGSFGWAGDGTKLVDKTLCAMGMRRARKPLEVLFAPKEADFCDMEKAVDTVMEFYRAQRDE